MKIIRTTAELIQSNQNHRDRAERGSVTWKQCAEYCAENEQLLLAWERESPNDRAAFNSLFAMA